MSPDTDQKMRSPVQRAALLGGAALFLLAALAVVIATGLPGRAEFTGQAEQGRVVAPEVGATAPDFTGQTPDGTTLALADLRGQPVVVNFWATWCGPCRVEMPELEALYQARGEDGLRVIGVNVGEKVEDVLDWTENYGLTFDMVLDPKGEIADAYMLRGQPTTIVITPDGTISHIFYGAVTRAQLEQAL